MTVATSDINALSVLVNGYPRRAKSNGSDNENWEDYLQHRTQSGGMTALKIRVPLYLADTVDGRVTIQTKNATILEHDKKYKPVEIDDSTVMIALNCEKSSFLFKTVKQMCLPLDKKPARFNVDKYAGKFMLSPSNFTASFMLALEAGCVGSINTRFLAKFKQFMEVSEGRAAKTLALAALKAAGQETFLSLSDVKRWELMRKASTMNLSQNDLKKIRENTVLVQSELENCS